MQLFGLAKTGLENNLPQLTSALLNLLQSSLGPEEYGGLLNKLAQTLASQEKPRPDSANLRLRLIDCVAYLNQHHYHARWEAHKTGPRVILHHCPYLDIMNHHPELCAFDRSFLENWLGDAVEQVAKLAALPQGTTYCCFQVRR
jgi:predicted ArsR family transcriptional regulator